MAVDLYLQVSSMHHSSNRAELTSHTYFSFRVSRSKVSINMTAAVVSASDIASVRRRLLYLFPCFASVGHRLGTDTWKSMKVSPMLPQCLPLTSKR